MESGDMRQQVEDLQEVGHQEKGWERLLAWGHHLSLCWWNIVKASV